jgi:ATP-dependent DNA helicase RecQ
MHQKRKIPYEVRQAVYERDRETCQEPGCEASRYSGDTVNLHHILPEQFGGQETADNLVTLCDIHHKGMHVDFHALYPDSENILRKMNRVTIATRSRLRKLLNVDDGYDLLPYLEFLTGQREFREGQLKTIRAALNGKDVLYVTPTGSGKSLCYLLPGFMAENPSLIISPLKALMKDQVESIWKMKIPATYINSDLSSKEKIQRFKFIGRHLYKFIFVAPERFFKSKDASNNILYQPYAYLVVDEAHEIDLWGKSFRSSYSKIGQIRTGLNSPPVIALTASASQATQVAIRTSLNMSEPQVVVTGFYRNNIQILKYNIDASNVDEINSIKTSYIEELIKRYPAQKILVFVPTKKAGEELSVKLQASGYETGFYFGDLDTKKKMEIQDRFKGTAQPILRVLISTSAFGMGINIPDIRHVVHWTPALGIEDYYQQIGRAGRDNKQSHAHLLYNRRDDSLLRFMATVSLTGNGFMAEHNYTDEEVKALEKEINGRLDVMLGLLKTTPGTEWSYILDYFGQKSPNFWERHGKFIADLLGVVTVLWIAVWSILGLYTFFKYYL